MKDWRTILLRPEASMREAIEVIDKSGLQIALVVDENLRLLGTVTDGDIRRGILKGLALETAVHVIMNDQPTVVAEHEGRDTVLALMTQTVLRNIPIVDAGGRVVDLETLDDLLSEKKLDNPVVLMAGGEGVRLRPLTDKCPKPLLKVGNKPILETILESFIEYGFHRFYISLNYKAEMIRKHFGDGSRWGVNIHYITENARLGTAGALRQMPERQKQDKPIIVMNGDILTKINFAQLLKFHGEHQAVGTMCIREYSLQIPYGVVTVDGQHLRGIEEKPVQKYFISAGIYVLNPQVVDFIPEQTFFDMPQLFNILIQQKLETAAFPLREYWLDIGNMADFQRANGEYTDVFTSAGIERDGESG